MSRFAFQISFEDIERSHYLDPLGIMHYIVEILHALKAGFLILHFNVFLKIMEKSFGSPFSV